MMHNYLWKHFVMDGNDNENSIKGFIKHCLLFQGESKLDYLFGVIMWIILIVLVVAVKDLLYTA